jgi:cytochrome c peroxidase
MGSGWRGITAWARGLSARPALAGLVVGLGGLPLLAAGATTRPPIPRQYLAEEARSEAGWTAEQSALGKRLFRDRRLSRDGSVACIDCHLPHLAYTDGRPRSVGIGGQLHLRNAPPLVNLALGRSLGWEGREQSLESFVLGPIRNPQVMDLPIETAVRRLNSDVSYRTAFRRAFGGQATPERLASALAAYQRSIYSIGAPFDDYMAGDRAALGPAARKGLALFHGRAGCSACHSGARFTDEAFHAVGIGADAGRAAITGATADVGRFRTPSLREVARTAPYMHDGSLATLAEVVDYFDRGGNPHPNLDPRVRRLGLTVEDKAALVAFMEALSGTLIQDDVPIDLDER